MLVYIIGSPHDPQVERVAGRLRRHGADVIVCDAPAFPASIKLSLSDGEMRLDGQPLRTPDVVYVRGVGAHPLAPGFEDDLAARPRGLIAQCDETRGLLESFILDLQRRGARIINTLEANALHGRKPYQLALLRNAGLPTPRWLATNDPAAVRRFVAEVGEAVYKPVGGGATVRRVDRNDLSSERLSRLAHAPVLFEERLYGVSIRAYVVGGEAVGAAAIESEELDSRRAEGAVTPTPLSAEEEAAAVSAARACGMAFAGVDLIRGRRGFHVLESNPSPMFAVYEDKTGQDIAGPLASLLVTRR